VVTIRDVARAAGVSIATVSRVLNGSTKVNAETRRRVREAAAKLDYWPNGAARSLTSSRTNTLGILLPDLFGEFFSEVIRGIDHAARREKLQVLVSSSHADTEAMLTAARSMRGRIDGLIAMAPEKGSGEAIERIAQQFPVVLMSPRVAPDGCSSISIANYEGAYAMVDHLLGIGHAEIAMLKGPPGNVDAEERLRGYRDAARQAGRVPRPDLEIEGDFTESSGYQAAFEVLRRRPYPTAVFAANDNMALGFLSAMSDLGVEVPGEMAVTGFDDIAISQYLKPPLTTVRVDAYAFGERAVGLWIAANRAESPKTDLREVIPATVVVRNSCGSGEGGSRGGTRRRGLSSKAAVLRGGGRGTEAGTLRKHSVLLRSEGGRADSGKEAADRIAAIEAVSEDSLPSAKARTNRRRGNGDPES
jgi:LacI family transcriptional regulator